MISVPAFVSVYVYSHFSFIVILYKYIYPNPFHVLITWAYIHNTMALTKKFLLNIYSTFSYFVTEQLQALFSVTPHFMQD